MTDIAVQASFNSGEWAPALSARVDLQKYRSGAALLENFFVDYRGGASSRPGTKYIIQAYKSSTAVRLITFQAAFNIGYVLEFGDHYIRFIFQGSPVLENSFVVSGATRANPCVLTVTGNNFSTGDWIFIANVSGMVELDGRYFSVLNVAGAAVTIGDLNGNPINSSAYTAYISGGTAARIYTIASPYAAADLALVKFAQSINQMILCHPAYATQILTLVTAINWTIVPIVIGSTAAAPANPAVTSTLGPGQVNYSYAVTSIDAGGQESSASTPANLLSTADIRTVAGSNKITWSPATGAQGYRVYESTVSYFGVIPYGVEYGFIGNCKSNVFIDTNIGPDYSQSPPIHQNPFSGSGVASVAVTAAGTYTTVPTVTFSGGSPSIPASAIAELQLTSVPTITAGGSGYVVNEVLRFPGGFVLQVTAVTAGAITAWKINDPGAVTSGSVPANPVSPVSTSGSGINATATAAWGVGRVIVLTSGAGYGSTPTVVFSTGAATATATLAPSSTGNPSVAAFFQERLVLAAPSGAPQTFYMSQPGAYFNFDITEPVQADNAITGTLVSGTLNTIKAIVPSTAGMLILTDKASWLVTGGGPGTAVTPTMTVANAQSFVGASDVPPIVANYDILYVQSKGSGVRDLAYNIYYTVFTGTDISILASHLFFNHQVKEWAWAEHPFYVVWAVRDDGVMLTLTFLKEQDFIAWTHQVTPGNFRSVCAVIEPTASAGTVDAVYTVVERVVNSVTVKYIERVAERVFPNGLTDAWCVDCGLQYVGTPQASFIGAEHLAGLTCTGLADGVIIPPFVMPASGQFTIPTPASKVTVGLGFTCKLKTLAIELGEPTSQGKVKKIPNVDVRVSETLGLQIGNDFDHLTPMKDLVIGNVSSMLTGQASQQVTGLYTGDARTFLSPAYTVPGQYCIQQSNPYPASILGVFPAFVVGDDR